MDPTNLQCTRDAAGSFATVVIGEQQISKGKDASDIANRVLVGKPVLIQVQLRRHCSFQVHLGVVRLFRVQSELLISLNTPLSIHEQSRAAEGPQTAFYRPEEASALFASVMSSVVIKDWTLFG